MIENEIITGFWVLIIHEEDMIIVAYYLRLFSLFESMNRKQQEQKLKAMSYLDSMTHIFNRNALIERIDKIKKVKIRDIGIAYFDLND